MGGKANFTAVLGGNSRGWHQVLSIVVIVRSAAINQSCQSARSSGIYAIRYMEYTLPWNRL